jgi:hypothetical protein
VQFRECLRAPLRPPYTLRLRRRRLARRSAKLWKDARQGEQVLPGEPAEVHLVIERAGLVALHLDRLTKAERLPSGET